MIRYAISSGWFRPNAQRAKRENPVVTTSGYIGNPYNTSVTSDERYLSTAVTSIVPSPIELIWQGLGTEKNSEAIITLVETVDWQLVPPAAVEKLIQHALDMGCIPLAMKVAETISKKYPGNERLMQVIQVLSPAKIAPVISHPPADIDKSYAWLKAHMHDYSGQWVALQGAQLIAMASSLRNLREQLVDRDLTELLISRVISQS